MPIVVKDFNWRQTESTVTILVPLRGVNPSKVDVFTSERYLKLSYTPFFFDALLLEPIDTSKSICTFTSEHAVFELTKVEHKEWPSLECDLPRKEKNELKRKYTEEQFQKFQKECENRVIKKHELKRVAVRQAISQDTKEREHVANLKESEKNCAMGNLTEWRSSLEECKNRSNCIKNGESGSVSSDTETEDKDTDRPESKSKSFIATKLYSNLNTNSANISKPSLNVKSEPKLNPIRESQTVSVSFSKRELPTPCRESRMEEENEYLRKQAEARRSVGFADEDLRPEEKNPQFVKWKGDEFLKKGNYLGAISAYTFGIQLSPKLVDLYLGRLEAQFAIGNFHNCAKDCSKALELMKPEVPANLQQRVQCIFRRGVSVFKLGFKDEGANEVRAALKLQPNNEEIKAELEKLEDIIDDMADQS